MEQPSFDDLITQKQAADIRGVSHAAIADLVRRGRLATVEIAGRKYLRRDDVIFFRRDKGGRSRISKRAEQSWVPRQFAGESRDLSEFPAVLKEIDSSISKSPDEVIGRFRAMVQKQFGLSGDPADPRVVNEVIEQTVGMWILMYARLPVDPHREIRRYIEILESLLRKKAKVIDLKMAFVHRLREAGSDWEDVGALTIHNYKTLSRASRMYQRRKLTDHYHQWLARYMKKSKRTTVK